MTTLPIAMNAEEIVEAFVEHTIDLEKWLKKVETCFLYIYDGYNILPFS